MRFVLSVLLLGLVSVGFAQGPTPPPAAVVSGVVVDTSGRPIAGTIVELVARSVVLFSTTTDSLGGFRFHGIRPGTYEVRARTPQGWATASVVVADGASDQTRPVHLVAPGPAPAAQEAARLERPTAAGVADTTAHAARQPAAAPHNIPWAAPRHHSVPSVPFEGESYATIHENGFHRVADDPLSTFSIDVDTASYANVRRWLTDGSLPPADAVRTEELINYFRFEYANPAGDRPFGITTEVGPAPWAPEHRLVLVGLKARPIAPTRAVPRNLVFLLDVSGSMATPDKLPLVKSAMRMLTATLSPADRVAIVVYAGASGVALPSTSGGDKERIDQAIADLTPGGSTNGAAGIRLAYDIAARSYIPGGINRVLLATDGDFNVGTTSQSALVRLIEAERERGIFLSVLGVGTGNLKDSTMEQLANRGNGNYSYLDSLHEARRVLVAEAGGTLVTVAKDVKIQVEFNPATVGAYRLIGYENRALADRDFNDDGKDAGEMGAGHTVTALYEIVPTGMADVTPEVDPLKYQTIDRRRPGVDAGELATVKLRYKAPDGAVSQLTTTTVRDRVGALTPNLGFATAVAEFGMLLRRSPHAGRATWSTASDLARRYRGADPDGYRAEFARLVALAAALDAQTAPRW